MRHKTITLCPTSYELAQKMPNFSQWVRELVLATQLKSQQIEKFHYACLDCDVVFSYNRDHGETSICRRDNCGQTIGRYLDEEA